jgi:hypothetical protein
MADDRLNSSMTARTEAEILLAADKPDATYRELVDGFRVLKAQRYNAIAREQLVRRVIEDPAIRVLDRTTVTLEPAAEGVRLVVATPATELEVGIGRMSNPEALAQILRQGVQQHMDRVVQTLVEGITGARHDGRRFGRP